MNSSVKILIADDEERWRRLVGDFLRNEGYKTVEAANGQEAVELIRQDSDISMAILDIMMPVMDGLTATRAIRALERADAKTIPIIAMTANAFEEDARKCLDAGMNMHLAKPLCMEELVATLAQLCA